jgi:DNA-binding response OmpR family regulator
VDDDEMIRRMLSLLLARALPGCQVSTAADGLAAQASIPGFRPHLIVTGLAMPGLDGAGLCRWVKSNGFARTKVLVFTGDPAGGLLAQALAAGADGWLRKPPEVAELLARVGQLLAIASSS